jgi:serine/threonine protein kinase/Tfp pilus assembly protein PilF
MALPAPDLVPGYRIIRELGRGGMATVYLAVQESLGREVALKLLAPRLAEDPQASERFTREARTAARLMHRHIVGIYDVGSHNGQPYLSMEFLPGDTSADTSLAPAEALQIVREIALALDHAHRQGVVHRDIKPENILRRADGSHVLADFGIARATDTGVAMTQEGITLGTPNYMSPEQLQGKELDGRADLYSLGVVLYQLLTGALPYAGTDGWSVGMQHISAPCPTLPAPFARYQPLIDSLMAKQTAQRPQTGADAARMIESALAWIAPAPTRVQAQEPQQPPQRPHPQRPPAANRSRIALVALAAAALVAWGTWAWWPRSEATPTAAAPVAPIAKVQRSIAVLPLVNLSRNPDNEYFSDGLAETMLDMLARVPDLTVIARTSSFAFKDKAMDVREIGKSLGVTHLLEGSVQQSGEQLRITLQLIRTDDGAHLWSQHYDRPLADVFKLQDEVAAEVVRALEFALPKSVQQQLRSGGTENVAAYQQYLKGEALLSLRKVDELRAALGHFESAIKLDPLYAQAYVGAANAMTLLRHDISLTPEQLTYRANLIKQALQIDPALGEAYVARAALLRGTDRVAAERDFKRGLELEPNYATGHQWYGEFLANDTGRHAEAVTMLEKAVALDPLAPMIRASLAYLHMNAGQTDEAQRIADYLLSQHPDFPATFDLLSMLADERRDLVASLQAVDRRMAADPSTDRSLGFRCGVLLFYGALEQAQACLAAMPSRDDESGWREDMYVIFAFSSGNMAEVKRLLRQFSEAPTWQKVLAARLEGRPAEAIEIMRRAYPQWFERPLGKPAFSSASEYTDVASGLQAVGETQQAREVLLLGMKLTANESRTGNWTEAIALALLGDYTQACKSIERSASRGEFLGLLQLAGDPDLAPLRAQACFAPAYAKLKALSDAQIAAATKAGLIAPLKPAK